MKLNILSALNTERAARRAAIVVTNEATSDQRLVKAADLARHLSPVWARYGNFVTARGEGVYVYDAEGGRYLDFTSGIGVTNTGHCHPRVVEAIRAQAGKIIHAEINIQYHEPVLNLIEQLLSILPQTLDAFFFTNSGAEAIEASVKLAKAATRRPVVVAFRGGFHGRTHGTMALTSSGIRIRGHFEPLPGSVHHVPYPYPLRNPTGRTPEDALA